MKKLLIVLLALFCLTGCGNGCPDGYELDGDICKKEIDHLDAEEQLKCEESFELVDNMCYLKDEKEVLTKYGCEDGLTETNGNCVGTLKKNPKDVYTCTTGTVSGTKCVVSTEKPDALTKTPGCPSGYNYQHNKCLSNQRPPMGCDWENGDYNGCVCGPGDSLVDGFCWDETSVKYDYSCAAGTVLKNNKCYEETSTDATKEKGCDTGYTLTNNECVKNVNTKASTIKYCEEGYELVDNKCIREETKDPIREYNCPDGYDYKDNLCRKYAQIEIK